MTLIDTHAHLPMLKHKPLEQVLADAKEQGVTKFLCIGAAEDLQSAHDAVQLAESHDYIWASVGVHPHDAGKHTSLDDLEELLAHPRVVAVGETGLDFFRDWAPKDKQQELFENSIEYALSYDKPIIIHCRDAAEDTLATLKRMNAGQVGGVFHCYAQDAAFAAELKELNFLVSFPGTLTFKKANELRETAKAIPLKQIMLETDCPYMAPEPFRGKPSEPMHVRWIAEVLAAVKGISLEEVAETTSQNACELFGI